MKKKKRAKENIEVEVGLIEDGDKLGDIDEICPMMSNFETGADSFIGLVKCIKGHCKCWDNKKKKCGLIK